MGISGGDPSKNIDSSVGGLVWVRRRNGSWWPGRILGSDELPEGCVATPKSGTPVKLLGREDASVDWYNLEKSKRIKDFHCGEYDSWIEKAKSAATHLSKKGVRYARREDAILHALELENARLGKHQQDLSNKPATQNGNCCIDESASRPSEESDNDKDLNKCEDDSDSARELPQSGISFEAPDQGQLSKEEPKQSRTPNNLENNGGECVERTKGLEDLGIAVASSAKRKRSQVAHVHEFLKKKNRRRTLTKVLESTAVISIPVTGENLSSPAQPSFPAVEPFQSQDSDGVQRENGTLPTAFTHNENSSMLAVANDESSQKLLDVPLTSEEKQSAGVSLVLSDASEKVLIGAEPESRHNSRNEAISLGNEDRNESGSTTSGANVLQIGDKIEKGTSEWQLKGKRNSRSRKTDVDNEAEPNVPSINGETILADNVDPNIVVQSPSDDSGGVNVKSRPITEIQVEENELRVLNRIPEKETHLRGSTADSSVPQRSLPYRQSRFTVNPKYDSSDFPLRNQISESGLYDIAVKVKTSNPPQHVPFISLMSKSTSQPITGYPLPVEVLTEGFYNFIIRTSRCQKITSKQDLNPSTGMISEQKSHGKSRKRKSRKSRKNGVVSKKTRKLSSLTGSHRLNKEQKGSEARKLKGPSIACVPLTVVFSRINAALSSSVRPVPRLSAAGSVAS